ncbi:hypothetical protein ACT6QH_01870 [Xanthobacter sp. TB0139]|uniref:hypothetical protein n=1 Tax=Xanthobacter sp. TB0139 TaxID=3459178 RepID=UPI004039FF52
MSIEDGGVFLAILRPGQAAERVPLTPHDVLRLLREVAGVLVGGRIESVETGSNIPGTMPGTLHMRAQ